MSEAKKALRRRIAPSVSLTLELANDGGSTFTREFRLSFDFNALAVIEDHTGIDLLKGDAKEKISAKVLGVIFWASLLAHHPEYDSDEGLGVIRSYMDLGNAQAITEKVFEAFTASLPKEKLEAVRAAANPTSPAETPA